MQTFQNILYLKHALKQASTTGLQQALRLAHHNQVPLTVLALYPDLPLEQITYRDAYWSALYENAEQLLNTTQAQMGWAEAEWVEIKWHWANLNLPAAVSTVKQVLRSGHDLLIKEAELKNNGIGFKALDMTLLRKCPCPVWLAYPQPIAANWRIAVAINPESRSMEEQQLSIRLLQLAQHLAEQSTGKLAIVSCWDYPFEDYLRYNARVNVPHEVVLKNVLDTQNTHRALLEDLLSHVGNPLAANQRVYHLRGIADKIIPQWLAHHPIDLLVMGTVARSGIKGFLMGNTAENIVEELATSLLALKPEGFVSTITLD
ncbi:MAG: universal stress protein [Thiofilum sp.]|uniref:universal stress protein n=1 Tax=Thiofilum sp. TaxID=2212733 RepID=UPI0025FD3721|nr:universal stress protein [Thiofilum sp.]MBK8452759.1 universal stress protein [Thiofilum sp.]